MASAGRTLGRQYNRNVGRDGFRFLGRTRTATKSLKGRLAVAQPPGATMAVTGKQVNTRHARSKEATSERLTTSKKTGSFLRRRSGQANLSGRAISPPRYFLAGRVTFLHDRRKMRNNTPPLRFPSHRAPGRVP